MLLKTCCFTGHRYKSFNFEHNENHEDCINIKKRIKEEIINLIENHNVNHFISGMALAVDQWGAEIVIELKEIYPNITIECALPCETQAKYWNEKQRNRYYDILSKCDNEVYISTNYTHDCMIKRNEYMIFNSDFVIAVWNGQKSGGTYNAIKYTKKTNKKLILIIDCNKNY